MSDPDTRQNTSSTVESQQNYIEKLKLEIPNMRETLILVKREREEKKKLLQKFHSAIEDMERKSKEESTRKVKVIKENWKLERQHLDETLTKLEGELAELEKRKTPPPEVEPRKSFRKECEAAHDQNSILEDEIEELTNRLTEIREKIEKTCEETRAAFNASEAYLSSVENSREMLKISKERLASLTEEFQDVENEKARLSNEISLLKSGGGVATKNTNSLFAEVENKRQVLADEYARIKEQIRACKAEIETLKAQNNQLRCSHDEEETSHEEQHKQLLLSYIKSIDELYQLVAILKKRPETPKIIEITDQDLSRLGCMDKIIEEARAESERLQKMLRVGVIPSNDLFMMERQVKEIEARCLKLDSTIRELTADCDKYRSKFK